MHSDVDLAREAELISYDVLHRPVLEPLRALTTLAAELLRVRMAEINVVSTGQTIHLSKSDDTLGQVPVEHSFCSRTVLRDERTFVVHDAAHHPDFASSPYVDGTVSTISFYAGTRLVTPRGITIGTFCVWHDEPHDFTEDEQRILESLAVVVVSILEMHRDSLEAAGSLQRMADSHRTIARSNESLEAFAGQVGHDLRTPLASMRLALSLLGDTAGVQGDSMATELTARTLSISTRMQHSLDDLVDFSVLGGGLSPEPVPVADVITEVLEDLVSARGEVGVEFRVDTASLPTVLAYRSHVHAILQNLLGNAIKYAAGERQGAVVSISGTGDSRTGRVVVSDDGPGVPEQMRRRVFDLSVRGDHPGQSGHGVGLATCARLVGAMSGTIGVEETPGGGASFWFELPTTPPDPVALTGEAIA